MYLKHFYFKELYQDPKDRFMMLQSIMKTGKKNADEGNMQAIITLIHHYINPRNEDYDPNKAFEYAMKGYKNRDITCTTFLAYFYLNSIGCTQDIYEANSILEELIERDNFAPSFCYYSLIDLYINDPKYQNLNQAIKVIKSLIDCTIENQSSINQVSINDFPDKNEFQYQFEQENLSLERQRKIKDILNRSSYMIISQDEFDEDFMSISEFGKILYLYLTLIDKIENPSLSKAKEYLSSVCSFSKKVFQYSIYSNDFEEYFYSFSPFEYQHPLYLNGHFLDEDESIFNQSELEKQAEYHVTKAIETLSLGYLGKLKYYQKDFSKAFSYLQELYENKDYFAVPYLAMIYHDGLNGIVDKQKAYSLLSEHRDKSNTFKIILAKYKIDDGDIKEASELILDYVKVSHQNLINKINALKEITLKNQSVVKALPSNEKNSLLEFIESQAKINLEAFSLFEKGEYKSSRELFLKTARSESVEESIAMMAYFYLTGVGGRRYLSKAIEILNELISMSLISIEMPYVKG